MYQPNYSITNKMLNGISSIEAAREIIQNSPLVPYWERQFREEAYVRIAHHTTALEGNPLTLDEARQVLASDDHDVKARTRHVQEVINYREVIKYIEALPRGSDAITLDHLLDIHRLVVYNVVPEDESGVFREGWFGTQNSQTGEISFVAPDPENVEGLVDGFFEWIMSDAGLETHPVLKSGITIAEVARIHPFTDGNGRTARAMGTASLYLDGYDIKRFFCLDEYYDQNAPDYYDAIQSYQQPDDSLNQWLEFFIEGLDVELSRIKARVWDMSKDQRWKREIGQVALTDRQQQIMQYLDQHGQIRNQDWQELFPEISDDTVLRDLKDMQEKGLIVKKGKTKAARYELK